MKPSHDLKEFDNLNDNYSHKADCQCVFCARTVIDCDNLLLDSETPKLVHRVKSGVEYKPTESTILKKSEDKISLQEYKKLIRNKLHTKKTHTGTYYVHGPNCSCTWCKKAIPQEDSTREVHNPTELNK